MKFAHTSHLAELIDRESPRFDGTDGLTAALLIERIIKRKLSNTICSIIRVPNVKCELFVEYFERVENSQEFFIMKTLLTHEEFLFMADSS